MDAIRRSGYIASACLNMFSREYTTMEYWQLARSCALDSQYTYIRLHSMLAISQILCTRLTIHIDQVTQCVCPTYILWNILELPGSFSYKQHCIIQVY